jgi:hypothetical protein
MSRSRSRILVGLAALAVGAGGAVAEDWKPPEVAVSLRAFEAQYPKQSVSAAALEIEGWASSIGIDAAQDSRAESCDKAERMAPSERTRTALSAWVTRELEGSGEAISAPPPSTVRFMEENDAAVAAIVAAASGRREVLWDLDVGEGTDSPVPNWVGLTSVQRVLAARALLDLRRKDEASALDAIEAIWRIAGSLAERPELLSQLTAIAQARLAVGLLRKVQSPAYGWETRLREGQFLQAFLAALQNDPWAAAKDPSRAEQVETLARVYRRFADGLIEKGACAWTRDDLQHSWEVAVSGEPDPEQVILTISPSSIINMLMRSYRLLLDSELTALVLEARAERAASRQDEWPARLPNLESTVCSGRFFAFRRAGGITLSFEGNVPADESGLTLPLKFQGAAPPAPKPTPAPRTAAATSLP